MSSKGKVVASERNENVASELQNASKGSLRNAGPVLNWITDL